MRILVIGGGIFLGRALIEAAVAAGHEITAFSRGRTSLPQADQILSHIGDRDRLEDFARLAAAGPWDAVIDTCAYWPSQVSTLLAALGKRAEHYTLVSSISAYADLQKPGVSENDALAKAPIDPGTEISRANYGPLKAACEHEAVAFEKTWIVRPGIIAGPFDPTDRFTYWVDLLRRNVPVLLPEDLPSAAVQVIDVRDLADWMIRRISAAATGTVNAVGPSRPLKFGEMLAEIADGVGSALTLVPLTRSALEEQGADLEKDFPFYVPPGAGVDALFEIDGRKAWAEGLTHRPLSKTARDTAAWFSKSARTELKTGWPAAKMAQAQSQVGRRTAR